MNLLFGAAVATRAAWLRSQGIALPGGAGSIRPMELTDIRKWLGESPIPSI